MQPESHKSMEVPRISVRGIDGQEMDQYTASIELSNACREFYVSRVRASENMRQKLEYEPHGISEPRINRTTGAPRKRTSIDSSMETLRKEMASLIDQDLALMKQLLTLNEQIEELKWQRRYCCSRSTLASSCNLDSIASSACTLSETEAESYDLREYSSKYPTPSSLSLYKANSADLNSVDTGSKHSDTTSSQSTTCHTPPETTSDLGSSDEIIGSHPFEYKRRGTVIEIQVPVPNTVFVDQQSFDSGILDTEDNQEIIV